MPRFHFSLLHLEDAHNLEVSLHDQTFPLVLHSADTHAHARNNHPVLSQVSAEKLQQYSHFAEIEDHHLEGDAPRWLQVVRPLQAGAQLQEVVLMSQIIPPSRLYAFYNSAMWKERHALRYGRHVSAQLKAQAGTQAVHHHGRLEAMGIMADPDAGDRSIELLMAAQELVDLNTTASGLIAHHPNLANVQPTTAAYIRDAHILPDPRVDPDQYNAMQALSTAMGHTQSWSPVVDCMDKNGDPILADYDLHDKDQPPVITAGQKMQTFSVEGKVLALTAPASSGAQRSSSNDMQLQNQVWSATPGTSALRSTESTTGANSFAATALGDPKFKWTVPYQTYTNGIKLDKDSLKISDQGDFSIDCYNLYNRTLYVAYELFDDSGVSIGGKRTLIGSFSAVDNIMGIPIPVIPTTEAFNIGQAAKVVLYFGSLGVSNWDKVSWEEGNVSDRGALLTGGYQYGVPIVFMIAGKAITSTSWFNAIIKDKDLTIAAIAILSFLVTAGVATAAALSNWKKVMMSFANVAISFMVKKGMEKLGEWMVAEVGAGQLSKAFGPIGWLFQLVAAGLNVEQMAITTGEVLRSDSLTAAEIKRAIDVKLSLRPDPAHGEAGNRDKTAVWPSVASTYTATLQCKGGTNFVVEGSLPPTTTGDPIPIFFPDVPGGGDIRVFVGLYSENGWLAGSWQNNWMPAVATQGTTLDLGEPTIKENLVPLGIDTQYQYKEKIVYDNSGYTWKAKDLPPATTLRSLNCADNGALCDLDAITINNSAFQVGYAWRAAQQHLHPDSPDAPVSNAQLYSVQNLSVLQDPSKRLKTTEIGFTQKLGIAYAMSTNDKDVIDQTNFILDPRNGTLNLRKVTLGEGSGTDFGLGDPKLLSWGSFPLDNLDAMVIHPSNAVLACSFSKHKLMILKLPENGSPDGQAPEAVMISGKGIREGLMQGPKALTVAPDGRILVLESLNNRVQAFDIQGNAVPYFTPGSPLNFRLATAEVAQALDAGKVPAVFMDKLIGAGENYVAPLPDLSFVAELDGGKFQADKDPLLKALSDLNVILAYDPEHMTDPNQSTQIQVVEAGKNWILHDPRQQDWQIRNESGLLNVYKRPVLPLVKVQKPGNQWLLTDHLLGMSWMLEVSSGHPEEVEVFNCFTYFPLQTGPNNANLNYLDMAVEAQGYLYVLSYQNDGTATTDYLLDVYAPDGTFLFRSPDASKTTTPQNIVAGRIAVDIFRDLYALTYETLNGIRGALQPGVAHWVPTPPLFSFPLTEQPNFNDQNISAIKDDFADHKIELSNQAFILIKNPDGYWQVKDDSTIYHVYRTGDALQVYSVPA